jgi:hypothetical protein
MVINTNRAGKSGKMETKRIDMMQNVLMMLGYYLQGLCTFPNMVSNANMVRKSEKKKRKKNKT